ncbi:MAG: pyruvate kinase [Anaerolineae bacterium]
MRLDTLFDQLLALRAEVAKEAQERLAQWEAYLTPQRPHVGESGHNLAAYLALRQHDLRALQHELKVWGLSSLGRSEAHTLATLDAVLATLGQLIQRSADAPPRPAPDVFNRGQELLLRETERVLGPRQHRRSVRMMVTLPSEAAHDAQLVESLVLGGMDIARINCAHDGPAQWEAMAAHVKIAEQRTGHVCKIAMDLGGPKCRTTEVTLTKHTRLRVDDVLLLRATAPDRHPEYPNQARCTLPEAVQQAQIGHRVFFDDGKIGAVVEQRIPEGLVLRITQAIAEGDKLKDDKGINFPDTPLKLSPLTDKDLRDLPTVVKLAHMINYSFVQSADDVKLLQEEIRRLGRDCAETAIIAKVETQQAIRNLPEIIMAISGVQPCGVMIARGDLAVELGFERMAELQEEILWVCEAAHVPVIWATQVLESLAKKGRATRAEITDAAMAQRAEAVMLNKGPYILDAMRILNDVLKRMDAHQHKKFAQLRSLGSFRG